MFCPCLPIQTIRCVHISCKHDHSLYSASSSIKFPYNQVSSMLSIHCSQILYFLRVTRHVPFFGALIFLTYRLLFRSRTIHLLYTVIRLPPTAVKHGYLCGESVFSNDFCQYYNDWRFKIERTPTITHDNKYNSFV